MVVRARRITGCWSYSAIAFGNEFLVGEGLFVGIAPMLASDFAV